MSENASDRKQFMFSPYHIACEQPSATTPLLAISPRLTVAKRNGKDVRRKRKGNVTSLCGGGS